MRIKQQERQDNSSRIEEGIDISVFILPIATWISFQPNARVMTYASDVLSDVGIDISD